MQLLGGSVNPQDLAAEKRFYNRSFKRYGYDPRSLGWILGTQQIRFRQLIGIGNLKGCSVLDVGCGFGDLYGYLIAMGIKVDYTGVDLNENFINVARNVYPDAHFIVADFEDERISGKFDWAFESGIFNLKINDNNSFIRNTLKKMFKVVRRGVAADFIGAHAAIKDHGLYYQDRGELLSFCGTLSKRLLLKSDYRPPEFCIYMYKDRCE